MLEDEGAHWDVANYSAAQQNVWEYQHPEPQIVHEFNDNGGGQEVFLIIAVFFYFKTVTSK
jgi:hypothetical protein